jgi:hypothetical protein
MDRKTKSSCARFLLVSAFLACPCHFPLTVSILVSLLGGSTLAAFLTKNLFWLVVGATIYFLGALALGWQLLNQEKRQG